MKPELIFVPMLAHMLLVFALYIKLGVEKTKAVKAGVVDRQQAALNPKAWPEAVVKISNNIANQFETPILFYALSFIVFLSNSVNFVVVAIAGFYVLTRYLHAYFHVTSNYVPYRFKAFLLGLLILLGLTIWLLGMLLAR